LKFGKNLEGLVPLSESDPNLNLKIGDKVRAKIISIEGNKALLSLKI
jgi:ribosomal protein S1